MSITYWKGEVIERMSDTRAATAKQEVKRWAENYEQVTGSKDLGRQALDFYRNFDRIRGLP